MMESGHFSGKLAIQQRVLPSYRAAFFELLAEACTGGLSVFAGLARPDESIAVVQELKTAQLVTANNRHFLGPQSKFYRCYQPGIIDWLKQCQPDALIVEANPRYISTPRALRWMHARGKPVLGWGLGAPPVRGRLAGYRLRARQIFLDTLDGVIAYSQRGAEEYRQAGVTADRVFVAPNATTPRPQFPLPERPLEFSGAPKLLFVGRLQERKRLPVLFSACASMPEVLRPRLHIVGDGPDRESIERFAQELYSGTKFRGALYGEPLAEEFRWADAFALPGTGGLAVQQAMAYGLPVIVAQGDGTQGDLVRPENGWQTPNNDVDALRNALIEAFTDPARLRHMGAESYRIVREEINLERMVGEFMKALSKVNLKRF